MIIVLDQKKGLDTGADTGKKNEPPQNFPVSRFYSIFPRFFTYKIVQGSQVQTLR